jgi:serine/threonine protein phosphatase PrpC
MSFKTSSRDSSGATVASLTDVGRHRSQNQDSLRVAPLDGVLLLAVCDGMGGGEGGEIASALTTTTLEHALLSVEAPYTRGTLAAALDGGLQGAHEVVRSTARSRRLRDMGTTATAALVSGGSVVVGQVGDSRAYLLRQGRLGRLTRDQSLAQQLLEQGVLQPEDLATFEHGNIILQAVGSSSPILVDLTWAELRRGDVLMLCSDGLWGEVDDRRIAALLLAHPAPEEACRRLVDAANEAGGSDNITCVVARFDDPALPLPTPDEAPPSYWKLKIHDDRSPASAAFGAPLDAAASSGAQAATPGAGLPTTRPPVRPAEEPVELPLQGPGLLGAALVLAGAAALGLALLWCG